MDLQKKITTFLEQHPNEWGRIAADAGIDRTWPYKFMAGKIPNPTHRTLLKLAVVMKRRRRLERSKRPATSAAEAKAAS